MQELTDRQAQLETRSRDLAQRIRAQRGSGADAAKEITPLREELTQVVRQQFEVRTGLRRMELERIEKDLARLKEMLERISADLKKREQERDAIIERRLNQLLGDDAGGW